MKHLTACFVVALLAFACSDAGDGHVGADEDSAESENGCDLDLMDAGEGEAGEIEVDIDDSDAYEGDENDGDENEIEEGDAERDGDADSAENVPAWITIPSGGFEMGCSPNDGGCDDTEKPPHTVYVSSFEMTAHEITQAQYEPFSGYNPSFFADCPSCPVEEIDWNDAKAFCEYVGGRLPSEAEWEYAARAGAATTYYCGDDESCLDGIAWHEGNSGSETHPVGQKAANAFGLYDMLGNVWEWLADCYHQDYNDDPPADGGVWEGGDCSYRILRGGSSCNDAWYHRVSYRGRRDPDDDYRVFGFRCARD